MRPLSTLAPTAATVALTCLFAATLVTADSRAARAVARVQARNSDHGMSFGRPRFDGRHDPRFFGGFRGGFAHPREDFRPHFFGGFRNDFERPRVVFRPRFFHGSRVFLRFSISNFPPTDCFFFDPFCGRRFDSLDLLLSHCDRFDHPRVIEVISFEGGGPLGSYLSDGDGWGRETRGSRWTHPPKWELSR